MQYPNVINKILNTRVFMQYRSMLVALVILVLVGCGTTPKDQYIKYENYAAAYEWQIHRAPDRSVKTRKELAKTLKALVAENRDRLFLQIQKIGAVEPFPDAERYVQFKRTLDYAVEDGILSEDQRGAIRRLVQKKLLRQAIGSPEILRDQGVISAFPVAEMDRGAIAYDEYEKMRSEGGAQLKSYLEVFKILKESKDLDKLRLVENSMRERMAVELTNSKNGLDQPALSAVLEYVEVTGDRRFDEEIKGAISRSNLRRDAFLEGLVGDDPGVARIYPEFARSELKRREFSINFEVNGDQSSFDEIFEQISLINSWVVNSKDAKRKVLINRFKLQEQQEASGNVTEIVSDPNLATRRFIPKNASVMFDYSRTRYSLRWSYSLTDEVTRQRSKAYSGNHTVSRIECSNMRYQNVFGGLGALPTAPNDRVASFCGINRPIDYDQVRRGAAEEIAREILKALSLI